MGKVMLSLRIDETLRTRLEGEAASERRNLTNMLEAILADRYQIAAVGTDGKSPQVSPPTMTAAAKVEREPRVPRGGDRAVATVPADEARESARVGSSRSTTVTATRAHRRANMIALECPSREFKDGQCVKCGLSGP